MWFAFHELHFCHRSCYKKPTLLKEHLGAFMDPYNKLFLLCMSIRASYAKSKIFKGRFLDVDF